LAITKEKKDELIDQYMELLEQSNAIFLTEYNGLNVKQMQALRTSVRKADGTLLVTKNTLMLRALQRAGKPAPEEQLVGQLATGFAMNEVPSVAKALTDFMNNEEEISIRFGILGDKILSAEEVAALAKLPSLEELQAQILGMIQAPARNIVSTLSSGVRQVVNVLDAYGRHEGEDEQPEAVA
jgi:large subunit ribosomal protein L10